MFKNMTTEELVQFSAELKLLSEFEISSKLNEIYHEGVLDGINEFYDNLKKEAQ